MSRKNIENVYSLSPLQEGLLFHALYARNGVSMPFRSPGRWRGGWMSRPFAVPSSR
jgi:hypothetical protein